MHLDPIRFRYRPDDIVEEQAPAQPKPENRRKKRKTDKLEPAEEAKLLELGLTPEEAPAPRKKPRQGKAKPTQKNPQPKPKEGQPAGRKKPPRKRRSGPQPKKVPTTEG